MARRIVAELLGTALLLVVDSASSSERPGAVPVAVGGWIAAAIVPPRRRVLADSFASQLTTARITQLVPLFAERWARERLRPLP